MNDYNDDDFWTTLLFINDNKDRFIVVPSKYGDTFSNERWALPTFVNDIPELSPTDMALWLAETYLNLSFKEHQLRLVCVGEDEAGFKVYLFENNIMTPKIAHLFADGTSYGECYRTMSYHQAGLIHSGLDYAHKEILAEEAHLIEIYGSPFDGPPLKLAYSRGSLKEKVGKYAPKPL